MFIEEDQETCDKGDREIKCPNQIEGGRLLSLWTKWSVCDSSCQTRGLGIQTRQRICTKPNKCGDKKLHEERDCRSAYRSAKSACNTEGNLEIKTAWTVTFDILKYSLYGIEWRLRSPKLGDPRLCLKISGFILFLN